MSNLVALGWTMWEITKKEVHKDYQNSLQIRWALQIFNKCLIHIVWQNFHVDIYYITIMPPLIKGNKAWDVYVFIKLTMLL